ncbi:hypothetical protein ACIOG7_03740 [Streptomyces sp. NPDC087894]|uniref:hypothetical protein n=1 Tax=Streptomyces sp. NPDC087894 TaxID=3365816 RepID=UPI0037F4B3BF
MRNSKLLAALLAAGLLTAGCSSGDGDDGGSHRKSRANHGSGSDNDSDGGGSVSAPAGDLAVLVDGPQKDVVKSGDERLKVTPKPAPGAWLRRPQLRRSPVGRPGGAMRRGVPGRRGPGAPPACRGGLRRRRPAPAPYARTHDD